MCADDGSTWSYDTKGRLDLAPGAQSSRTLAVRIRDAVVRQGWQPVDRPGWADEGIQDAAGQWTVRATRGQLTLRVFTYARQPYVLPSVLGPCLPTSPGEMEQYMSAGTDRIDVPG